MSSVDLPNAINIFHVVIIVVITFHSINVTSLLQNLSPVLTKMAKEVDSREKELTHQIHREWLQRASDQVKQLTPALISGIKIFITTKTQGPLLNCQHNKTKLKQNSFETVLLQFHFNIWTVLAALLPANG